MSLCNITYKQYCTTRNEVVFPKDSKNTSWSSVLSKSLTPDWQLLLLGSYLRRLSIYLRFIKMYIVQWIWTVFRNVQHYHGSKAANGEHPKCQINRILQLQLNITFIWKSLVVALLIMDLDIYMDSKTKKTCKQTNIL